ncbi:MAG: GNAT family N-acetyltransferase [Acidimicrobiales bacterium]
MGDVPVVACARLTLRAWRPGDRAAFAAINADPRVMEHFPATLTRRESDAVAQRAEAGWSRGFGLWAVEERSTGRFIGFVGLSEPSFKAHFTPAVEVGWRLAYEAWGRGFATEAARATLEWARHHVTPPRGEIVSFTTVGNERSRRVMEKLGFTHRPDDDFDHPALADWEFRRHVLYRRALLEAPQELVDP